MNGASVGMESGMTLASTASGEETQAIPTPSVRCGKIKSTQIRDLCEDSMENEPNGGGETLESTVHCGKTPAWLSHLARGAMSGEETLMSTAFGEENSASTVGCTCDAKEEFVNCVASGEEKSASTAFGEEKLTSTVGCAWNGIIKGIKESKLSKGKMQPIQNFTFKIYFLPREIGVQQRFKTHPTKIHT